MTKAVGTAVTRNLVKRRMRAISRELLNEVAGSDLVVRALPGIDSVPWTDLRAELMSGVERGLQRR